MSMDAMRGATPTARTMRIAIVDDDSEFRGMLQALLGFAGYTAISLHDTDAVVAVLPASVPDALMLNLRMSTGNSGRQILERITAAPALVRVPVISCSADVFALRARQQELMANDYHVLEKPFALVELTTLVQTICAATDTR